MRCGDNCASRCVSESRATKTNKISSEAAGLSTRDNEDGTAKTNTAVARGYERALDVRRDKTNAEQRLDQVRRLSDAQSNSVTARRKCGANR